MKNKLIKRWESENTRYLLNKIKEPKGSVTLFVLVTCLFMITVLLLVNIGIMNRNANQEKELVQISKNYAANETDLANSYAKVADENGYPTYTEVQKMIEKAREEEREKTQKELEDTRKELEDLINKNQTELDSAIETAKSEAKLEAFPIGSIFMSTNPANPSSYIGGTWESYGEGRTVIGAGTGTDSNNTSQLFKVGAIGGEYTHKMTIREMPSHSHSFMPQGSVTSAFTGNSVTTSQNGNHNHMLYIWQNSYESAGYGLWSPGNGFNGRCMVTSSTPQLTTTEAGNHSHTVTASGTVDSTFSGSNADTSSIGSGSAVNNMQPYIVTYMWKRIR